MKVLILGVNGFIGHHLTRRILDTTDWEVFGMDMNSDRVAEFNGNSRFHFFEGDISINKEWIEYHVKKCDVVLPLVAIATPATYVRNPLAVFELDFMANLPIVEQAVRYKKRIVFPSTSEVYGMCADDQFHPSESNFVLGPIDMQRWIYSCSKQLMDRVIYAYGDRDGFDFTLFRPFNWIGPGLDSLYTAKEGSSRVVTQFLGHIARGENIVLVDGGEQRRTFTFVDDGINALMKILENRNGVATGNIYNIGHPGNEASVRELAEAMLDIAGEFPEWSQLLDKVELVESRSADYYGKGYQDIQRRKPWIENTMQDLDWKPEWELRNALTQLFEAYRGDVAIARDLVDSDANA